MNAKPVQFEKDRSARIRSRLLSPFSAKHANRVQAAGLSPSVRLAFGDTILTPDRRFLFVKNAKAACSTIAGVLYLHSSGKVPDTTIHRQNSAILQDLSHWKDYKAVLENDDCVAFTFVREPRKRFVSAFKDFFLDGSNHARKAHMESIQTWGFDPDRGVDWNLSVFTDYVAASIERDPVYTDRHWREQWRNVASGEIAYDFVGKVETYDADMATVFAKAGLADAWSGGLREHRMNESSKTKIDLPPAIARRVETIYARDFETFGYA